MTTARGTSYYKGGPQLGSQAPDSEDDGIPQPGSNGDDTSGNDDEDGVDAARGIHIATTPQTLPVSTSGAAGVLNAWVDFNHDGDWQDPAEQIFVDVALEAGDHDLPFLVPDNALAGSVSARFRYSSQAGLQPGGSAFDGEVEDHQLTLLEWTNVQNPLDVDGDGFVSPVDALILINRLNLLTSADLPQLPATPPPYFDVNNDGFVTPADSLNVINFLNRFGSGEAAAAPIAAGYSWPPRLVGRHGKRRLAGDRKRHAPRFLELVRLALAACQIPRYAGLAGHRQDQMPCRAKSAGPAATAAKT